jgi:mRNA deadenylase 3'-5' endonuclease subunit Ccr4
VSFTLATYNVLADSDIKREWYPLTPDHLLDGASRRDALLAHLVKLDIDLLCLQEVERSTFTAIESHLEPLHYRGHFSHKGRRKPDGCATFYRCSVLEFDGAFRLEFRDAEWGGKPSGHVAQLLSFRHEAKHIGIVNTHLKWDPPSTPVKEQYGYQQARQLLREHDHQLSGCAGWIVCGDFNTTPDGDLIALIQRAGFQFTHAAYDDAYTANINGRPKTIDYLFYSGRLCAEPMLLPTVCPDTALPGPDEPSDHIAVAARFSWR